MSPFADLYGAAINLLLRVASIFSAIPWHLLSVLDGRIYTAVLLYHTVSASHLGLNIR